MNNPDSSSMFAHIVSRLTNRTEDVAVDALGFILSRSDAARRALRDLLKLEGLDAGELAAARRTADRAPVRRSRGAPVDPLARTAPVGRAAVRLAAGRNAA